jgi:hypothetical protein
MFLDWLKNLLGCQEEKYKKLSEALQNEIGKALSDTLATEKALEELKSQLAEGKPKVSEFEKFLDSKFPITRLVYTKRWVFNQNKTYEMDVRDFITDINSLPKFNIIDDVFKYRVNYVYDNFQNSGILDFWQLPIETLKFQAGDCDDSGALRCALARRMGNYEVNYALGFYGNEGHFFNLMWDAGQIYIVENTSNKYEPIKIPDNDLTKTVSNYKICYVVNENKCWVVDGSVVFGEEFPGMVNTSTQKKRR